MVQKSMAPEKAEPAKKRGRPPAYDPELALDRALDVFWTAGYAATSLDDLVAATGMNRPSLYAAFGDKRRIYLKALGRYGALTGAAIRRQLAAERPLRDTLAGIFREAIKFYLRGAEGPRGCFSIGTAGVEAASDPEIRALVAESVRQTDAAFAARILLARAQGEATASGEAGALAALITATLHTLAVRARAGHTQAELDAVAAATVVLICGPAAT